MYWVATRWPEICWKLDIGTARRLTGLIEDDRDVFLRVLEKGEQDADFGDSVVGTAGVAAHAAGCSRGGKEDDRIAQKLDVGQQIRFLLVGELGLCGIKLEPEQDR